MTYGKYKDLANRTESDNVLKENNSEIFSFLKYDGYERGFASIVYNFFDQKYAGGGIKSMSNEQLADEFHKPIIRKFKIRKVYSSF